MLACKNLDITNARGRSISFVTQQSNGRFGLDRFEARTFFCGEVLVRPQNWHDLFNALVWMTFPKSKAVINKLHISTMSAVGGAQRTPKGDALTLFDEDGMIIVSRNKKLLNLIQNFKWYDLFWENRRLVEREMQFIVFGHGLYEKMLRPRVGLTGKGILIFWKGSSDQSTKALPEIDQILSNHLCDDNNLRHGKVFSPIPLLGVPGWFRGGDEESFYENKNYFRAGRTRKNHP